MGLSSLDIVDPHMHLWDLSRLHYGWLQDDPLPHNPAGDMSGIAHRSYLPADYRADSAGVAIAATVHVECGLPPALQLAETDWLCELAATGGCPDAIVAGADLADPELDTALRAQASRPRVRGIRQIVSFHPDPGRTYTSRDLLDDPAWQRGLAMVAAHQLSFDLQIYPAQMQQAAGLAARNPRLAIIVNHTGMPADRDADGLQVWRTGLRHLAAQPNVSCKISGLGMMDRSWSVGSLRPFVRHAIDCFGPARCMFASNFPVDRVHNGFARLYAAYDEVTADLSTADRHALFGGTARAVYRLPLPPATDLA